ncbi:hypothetical protein [Streptomyces luteogriseus]|uniref:hypothetical protein n=1 Tax=Streptomyces luteogriseus TaxID=68233 RepID=UPI003829ACA5
MVLGIEQAVLAQREDDKDHGQEPPAAFAVEPAGTELTGYHHDGDEHDQRRVDEPGHHSPP